MDDRVAVVVSAMSAHSDRPDDFLMWYRMRRCPSTQPWDFVPRRGYGDYLSDTLRRSDSSLLTVHRASVTRIFESTGAGLTVLLSDGVVIQATHVVLALGHAPAADPLPLRPEVKGRRPMWPIRGSPRNNPQERTGRCCSSARDLPPMT